MVSNLQCFLDSTTPIVPSQFLPKSEIRNLNPLWHPWEREIVEFFTLGDLWSCFDEWSAYGAGVPINVGDDETIFQYYVPYLSGIQIFTGNSSLNYLREETDYETRDSFSDTFSDESESEKLSRWDGCSSDEGVFDQETQFHLNDRLGQLYFQYMDKSTPYARVPLADKCLMNHPDVAFILRNIPIYSKDVTLTLSIFFFLNYLLDPNFVISFLKVYALSKQYPGLMSLRSVDLSPASWMSVAWYPIYHIPTGRTIKDLSACFLTYHTLSSSFQDMDIEDQNGFTKIKRKEGEGISLPPFGLVTYKMQGDIWTANRKTNDQEKLVSLASVADSWLRQLGVQHHDFNHFVGNRRG